MMKIATFFAACHNAGCSFLWLLRMARGLRRLMRRLISELDFPWHFFPSFATPMPASRAWQAPWQRSTIASAPWWPTCWRPCMRPRASAWPPRRSTCTSASSSSTPRKSAISPWRSSTPSCCGPAKSAFGAKKAACPSPASTTALNAPPASGCARRTSTASGAKSRPRACWPCAFSTKWIT